MFEIENNRQLWLEKGYVHFAEYGPNIISINKLSKSTGLSRASFYHHFGDIDIFIDELLTIHWQFIEHFNSAASEQCENLFPDLYILIEQNPIPLKFNLQLFHHRNTPKFNLLFIKIYEASATSFAQKLFVNHFGLKQPEKEIYHLWLTLGEAWYSRLDPEDLTTTTLQNHAKEILKTLTVFIKSPLYSKLHKLE